MDGGTNPTDNDYEVQVTVTDSGLLTETQDITVTVTDEVENAAPTITSPATASVSENQTSAIDVQSTDDNDLEGSGLTYSLSGGTDQSLFTIDTSTGVVTFNAAPDFEAPGDANGDNDYELQVTVTDSGGLTDVQDLTISVTDVVENTAPVITSDGGGATAGVSIDENTTLVTDVQTLDDNDAEGVGLTYSITGGDDQAFFTIDATTGELSFAAAPNFDEPADANVDNDYEVQVTVTDSGLLTDTQDITVTVNDVVQVWFVDNTAAAGGDGSQSNPFNDFSQLNGANGTGDIDGDSDTIFVFAGSGAYGNLELEGNQQLIGEGAGLASAGIAPGADPTLGSLTLATGNTVSGATFNAGMSGTNVGSLVINDVTVNSGSSTGLDLMFDAGTADVDVVNSTFNGGTPDGLLEVVVSNSANVRIDVTGSTFDPGTADGEGISFNASGSSQLDFNIIGNTITANSLDEQGIEIDVTGSAAAEGRINNNTITASDTLGILIDLENGTPTGIFEINNNSINVTQVQGGSILLETDGGQGNFTVTNNDMDIESTVRFSGITGIIGNSGSANYNIVGNDVNQVGAFGDAYAIQRQISATGTSTLEGFTTDVFTTLQNNNNTVGGVALNNPLQVFVEGTHGPGTTETVDISQPLMVTSLPTEAIDVALTAADLELITDAAIDRWSQTGLSASQIETLESLTFEVVDLPDWYIGAATGTNIQIDTNAFGWGWFVDSTPLEDSEFSEMVSAYAFQADTTSAASGQIDLLTTVMHEMGHALGLGDLRGVDQLMNATIPAGTRRLPTVGLANGVVPDDDAETEYIGAPVDLSTLNPGQSVTLTFEVTVNDPVPTGITQLINQATVTADAGISETAMANTAVTPPPQVSIVASDDAAGEDPLRHGHLHRLPHQYHR